MKTNRTSFFPGIMPRILTKASNSKGAHYVSGVWMLAMFQVRSRDQRQGLFRLQEALGQMHLHPGQEAEVIFC